MFQTVQGYFLTKINLAKILNHCYDNSKGAIFYNLNSEYILIVIYWGQYVNNSKFLKRSRDHVMNQFSKFLSYKKWLLIQNHFFCLSTNTITDFNAVKCAVLISSAISIFEKLHILLYVKERSLLPAPAS